MYKLGNYLYIIAYINAKINEGVLHERMLVMKFEVLKRSYVKRKIIIGVIAVLIISAVILNFTRAKYRTTQSIPLVTGTINYSLADLDTIAIYINSDSGYTKSDTIPESGYVLNEEESYCTVDGEEDTNISLSYDTTTKSLSVTPMTTQGTKCYLYFDEKGITNVQELIASKNLATRTDFSITVTEDTTGTIYYADTSKGRTYYFAGKPTDNWVYFAGFYWRIIRINEDGTLRLIYQGTSANSNTQIQTSVFNSSWDNNMYVGYMYGNGVHGLTSSSTVKEVLDIWYQNNLTEVSNKIDGNAGFCGDREPSTSEITSNGSGGTGGTRTFYGAYIRLISNKAPTFECENDSDLYTTSGSEDGNGALTYPIGLISADEVAYAGGVYVTTNKSYYLYTGQNYWTMSPFYFFDSSPEMFDVNVNGGFGGGSLIGTYGVRPVINLKADVTISSGDGTSLNPYVIS